jgi:hypothetical protein
MLVQELPWATTDKDYGAHFPKQPVASQYTTFPQKAIVALNDAVGTYCLDFFELVC